MGTMSYYPNIEGALYFVEEILPIIWQQNPNISFCIAGRESPQLIKDLAVNNSLIEVIANPEDMKTIAAQCSLSVVPLRSESGTRIKILHSMAMGLPVVSTNIGCEGLEVCDRKHLLIRDIPYNFAQGAIELIRNKELWLELKNNSRQLVKDNYNWATIFHTYEQELLKSKASMFSYSSNINS